MSHPCIGSLLEVPSRGVQVHNGKSRNRVSHRANHEVVPGGVLRGPSKLNMAITAESVVIASHSEQLAPLSEVIGSAGWKAQSHLNQSPRAGR